MCQPAYWGVDTVGKHSIIWAIRDAIYATWQTVYGSGTHEPEFTVLEQAVQVGKGITHNLQMEQECGDHNNRLIKEFNIFAVSVITSSRNV